MAYLNLCPRRVKDYIESNRDNRVLAEYLGESSCVGGFEVILNAMF